MAKPKKRYVCQACGGVSSRWQGQCADCSEWNSLVEDVDNVATAFSARHDLRSGGRRVELVGLDSEVALPARASTGIAEFDRALGGGLVAGIAGVVALALAVSYGIGRLLGLPPRMAVLVACGNSICGNSAIAATAPVIGADGDDVAAAIAFTAVLGVLVVLLLPLLVPLLDLSAMQYGVFAGLTVYAVPQILAATAPVGALSVQVGTLVKLLRVLMLGPVVVALALLAKPEGDAGERPKARPPLRRLVPWFILGFLALAGLRAAGLIPDAALAAFQSAAGVLTVLSMAALGLGVDVRMLSRAGMRVTVAAVLSLAALGAIGLGLIRLLGIH